MPKNKDGNGGRIAYTLPGSYNNEQARKPPVTDWAQHLVRGASGEPHENADRG